MSLPRCSPSCSPQPSDLAVTAPPRPARRKKDDPVAAAKRVARFRLRKLRELWSGSVRRCGGAEACPWRDATTPCQCRPGAPCRCERESLNVIMRIAEEELGHGVAGILGVAVLDLLRHERLGRDEEVRTARLRLLEILLRSQGHRQMLALQERRLELEEAARKPRGPSIADYLATRSTRAAPPAVPAPAASASRLEDPGAPGGAPLDPDNLSGSRSPLDNLDAGDPPDSSWQGSHGPDQSSAPSREGAPPP